MNCIRILSYERNVVQCNVQEKIRDAIATSVRIASEVVGSSTSYLQHNDKDPNYELARNYIPIEDKWFKSGWGRRKQHGKLYGNSYISDYEGELKSMFEVGVQESSRKMGPAKMRELLVKKYPNKFSIPSETDIKKITDAMFQKSKKYNDNEDGNEDVNEEDHA